jgi:hypothetical protein
MIRIGRATRHNNEARGFHAPGTTGPFGAAVACGRLMGFDAGRMRNALGIAGSLACGLLEFARSGTGAMVKRLHLGRAASGPGPSPPPTVSLARRACSRASRLPAGAWRRYDAGVTTCELGRATTLSIMLAVSATSPRTPGRRFRAARGARIPAPTSPRSHRRQRQDGLYQQYPGAADG